MAFSLTFSCKFRLRKPIDISAKSAGNSSKPLLAKAALAVLCRDVALVDLADLRRRWAGVELLHELAERALVALSFARDLLGCENLRYWLREKWESYAAVARVLHVAGQVEALGFLDREGAEVDALHDTLDLELDLP